jgi:hypothetical protein
VLLGAACIRHLVGVNAIRTCGHGPAVDPKLSYRERDRST